MKLFKIALLALCLASPVNAASTKIDSTITVGANLVWVNLPTGIYHRKGETLYGHTKHGVYMTETEAIRLGFRPVKVRIKAAPKA